MTPTQGPMSDEQVNRVTGRGETRWQRWRLPVLLIVLFSVALVWAWRGDGPLPESRIDWRQDWSAAADEARQAGRPMLVFATADWCPPCRSLKRGPLQRDEVVDQIETRFVPVKADVTREGGPGMSIASRFDVPYLPTFLVVDPAGNELGRVTGYLGDDELLAWLGTAARAAMAPGQDGSSGDASGPGRVTATH